MRSVVVDSPVEVITAVLSLLKSLTFDHFVDYGCGTGRLLTEIAKNFPDVHCVGIDIDDAAVAQAARLSSAKRLNNVKLSQGDVCAHVNLASDVAYLYLGGALNQRLGNELLSQGTCRLIIAVRYPIIGAIPTEVISVGSSCIYIYRRSNTAEIMEWDAPGTELTLPKGSAYLLSRAIRVTSSSLLSLVTEHRALTSEAAFLRSFEFGCVPARAGTPIILDTLIEGRGPGKNLIEISVASDGLVLRPSHLLYVTVEDKGRPTERLLTPHEMKALSYQFDLPERLHNDSA
jgi:hypothetical protein